jgi:hypothetical protein
VGHKLLIDKLTHLALLVVHSKANTFTRHSVRQLKMAPQLAWIGLGNMGRASIADQFVQDMTDFSRACAKYESRNILYDMMLSSTELGGEG